MTTTKGKKRVVKAGWAIVHQGFTIHANENSKKLYQDYRDEIEVFGEDIVVPCTITYTLK